MLSPHVKSSCDQYKRVSWRGSIDGLPIEESGHCCRLSAAGNCWFLASPVERNSKVRAAAISKIRPSHLHPSFTTYSKILSSLLAKKSASSTKDTIGTELLSSLYQHLNSECRPTTLSLRFLPCSSLAWYHIAMVMRKSYPRATANSISIILAGKQIRKTSRRPFLKRPGKPSSAAKPPTPTPTKIFLCLRLPSFVATWQNWIQTH